MNDWKEVSLQDLATEVTVGHVGPMAQHYREEGIPFLRSLNVDAHTLDLENVKYISAEFHAKLKKSMLMPGDVVTVRTGKPGTTSVIPEDLPIANCSDLVITRPGPKLDARWFSYYMNSAGSNFVDAQLVGAVQQHFNVGSAKNMRIRLPPLPQQMAMAEVLGSLDDKIATNTKLLATIDALVQAQFRATLADAHLQPLSDCAEFVNGKAFTKGASGTGRVVVRIAELNSGLGGSTVFSDAEVENKHVASPGDILFAWSGSLTLHRWFRDDAIVNQHIFKVIPRDGYPHWLVYELLRNKIEDFKLIAADKATTMGHIQRKHLDEPVLVPGNLLRQEISPLMETLWQASLNVERERLTLATIRDTLLPQLMSGSLKVTDSETMVASVV
ncbi:MULTISPECIES: restriction endonuclease subunit S [Micrococcaceae]|uniref:Type I restriction-modification system, specificity subunit S n=1 Tax=Arthrobacter rhombi TaxID=71253 RepID=A0A1R4FM82_9MICC|nr:MULTISPECIES: restriction endonuclease subunit S [Micrococcaceae]PCC25339.1 restriction endonuclease subunit S [Glutamicibacter sp. BW78]SJM57064.1 Type I restriction-modification system, specificity subunit S [Arthrobacter rhombi]